MSELLIILSRHGLEIALAPTILLGAGALAVRCSPSPFQRHRIVEWTLCLGVLAVALLLVPLPRLALTPSEPAEEFAGSAPVSESLEWAPSMPSPHGLAPIEEALMPLDLSPQMRSTPAQPLPSTRFDLSIPANTARWLSVGYLIGALALALHLGLSLFLLRRLVKDSRPAPRWVAELVPGGCATRISVTSKHGRPVCFGLGRGRILLPQALLQKGQERRLRAVLLHELGHLSQGHGRARLLAAVAAPLFYWQPLYWWLVRSAHRDAEFVADELASTSMDKRAYASELLGLIESTQPQPLINPASLGALGPRQNFIERMETLLMRNKPLTTRDSRLQLVTRTTLALAILGSVTVAWGHTPQDADPSPHAAEESVPFLRDIPLINAQFAESEPPRDDSEELPLLSHLFDREGSQGSLPGQRLSSDESQIEVEFRFSRMSDFQEFQRRIEAAGGEFQPVRVLELEGAETPVEGLGRLVGLTPEQRSPLSKFYRDEQPDNSSKQSLQELNRLRGEIQYLEEQLIELRQQAQQLEQQLFPVRQRPVSRLLPSTNSRLPRQGQESSLPRDVSLNPFMNRVLTGRVVRVSETSGQKLIAINRGSLQGAQVGENLEVYKDNRYKGRIQVTHVRDEFSAAKVLIEDRPIQAGDQFTSNL